jgi:hypothetical protein
MSARHIWRPGVLRRGVVGGLSRATTGEYSRQRGIEQWRQLFGVRCGYVILVEVSNGMANDHRAFAVIAEPRRSIEESAKSFCDRFDARSGFDLPWYLRVTAGPHCGMGR